MVKGWLQREKFQPYLQDPGVGGPELARAQALLADHTVSGTPEPVGHRIFAMDRSVHRRPQWTAAISMCSARTTYYENGNGENLRGWHTNAGMLYWWGADDQYSDAFWPTVDPYRLPGTTASKKALPDGYGGAWAHPSRRRPSPAGPPTASPSRRSSTTGGSAPSGSSWTASASPAPSAGPGS